MQLIDFLILINVGCVLFSWHVATQCFNRGDKFWGNFNIIASALNAAIVFNHIV